MFFTPVLDLLQTTFDNKAYALYILVLFISMRPTTRHLNIYHKNNFSIWVNEIELVFGNFFKSFIDQTPCPDHSFQVIILSSLNG